METVRSLIKRQRSVLSGLSLDESNSLLRVASELADPDDMVHLLLEAGLRIHETVRSVNFKRRDDVHVADANIVEHVSDSCIRLNLDYSISIDCFFFIRWKMWSMENWC